MIDRSLYIQASNLLKLHEGYSSKPYVIEGHLTIGYGRDLVSNPLTAEDWKVIIPNGISPEQANILLNYSLDETVNWLQSFKWWNDLTDNRKLCMIDMGYCLGKNGLEGFTNMIAAIEAGNWIEAADQIKLSKFYSKTGQRARNDVILMLKG